ncbi:MAG: radical SAM protein [Bacteroidales bacterium]|nr:radical SAM protein [Bacteroidales bacterium]
MVIILKPTYACNFRCKYCYLSNITKAHTIAFDFEFAKHIVLQVKEALLAFSKRSVTFIWHGGEPLLWGKENFLKILDFMQCQLDRFDLHNLIQTNLSLIDNEYIDILSRHNVKLSFSLDGSKEINDNLRVDINGNPTFDTIMNKLYLCREKRLDPGCIVVGNRKHIGHMTELYRFMKEHKLGFKFNPLFIAGEANRNCDKYSITSEEYAKMCVDLFDLWFFDSHNNINELNFVEIASNIATGHTTGCIFSRNCQDDFMAIAPNGDVMPCGRFCDEELKHYSYGNLHNDSLFTIISRVKNSDIYQRADYIANSSCAKCKWFNICHGGCPHDGYLKYGNFKNKSILCTAYKQIFAHIEKAMIDVGLLKK